MPPVDERIEVLLAEIDRAIADQDCEFYADDITNAAKSDHTLDLALRALGHMTRRASARSSDRSKRNLQADSRYCGTVTAGGCAASDDAEREKRGGRGNKALDNINGFGNWGTMHNLAVGQFEN